MTTPNNNPKQDEQLNPFVFPTETDGRFLLLVMMIAGVALGLILNLLYAYTRIESGLVLLAIAFSGVGLFFLWTRGRRERPLTKRSGLKGGLHSPHPLIIQPSKTA